MVCPLPAYAVLAAAFGLGAWSGQGAQEPAPDGPEKRGEPAASTAETAEPIRQGELTLTVRGGEARYDAVTKTPEGDGLPIKIRSAADDSAPEGVILFSERPELHSFDPMRSDIMSLQLGGEPAEGFVDFDGTASAYSREFKINDFGAVRS